MRVILLALALCAIAFTLNLIGDLSTTTSVASPAAPAARVTIAPAEAAEPPREPAPAPL